MNHFQRSRNYLACALCLLLSTLFISESTYSHSISTPIDIKSGDGTPVELVTHIDLYDDEGNFIVHLHDYSISRYTQEEVDEIHANNPHTRASVIEALPKEGDVKGVSQRTYNTPYFPSPDDVSEIGKPDPEGKYDNYGTVSIPPEEGGGGQDTQQQPSQDEGQDIQQQSSQDEGQDTQQSSQDEGQDTQQQSSQDGGQDTQQLVGYSSQNGEPTQDGSQGTQLPLLNLVVDSPQISKTTLAPGESFTFSVTVRNEGDGPASAATLRYYRGSDIGVSGTEVGENAVSPIAAMGTSDMSISLTAPDAPGTYFYYACISSVTGGSNTANTCTPNSVQLTVRGEPQDTSDPPTDTKPEQPSEPVKGSDLIVSIPVISKTVLDSGESFTLSVTVENTGGSLSPETILKYYRGSGVGVSGTEVGQKSVSPIAAMGTSDVSIELTAPDVPGTYLYYACISSVTSVSNTDNTCTPNSVQLTVRGEPQDTSGAPSVVGMKFTAAQIDDIEAQIALLAAKNDRSPAARQTLAYLRRLIAMARPAKTQLLANYPNPFNPETWIPYRLAAAANVTLTIYDIKGQVVRTLALGHQAAGMYQSRSRAAYWDGRNAFGEPVASGLYFYTLTAGEFTATRKMLIWK